MKTGIVNFAEKKVILLKVKVVLLLQKRQCVTGVEVKTGL